MDRRFLSIGLALIVGYLVFHFLTTPDIPMPIRLGVAAMSGGGLVLMASAIRSRLAVRPHDHYTEILR